MSRSLVRATLAVTLLSTAACTQPAAQIDNKGIMTFGRNASSGMFASAAPVSHVPETVEITPMPAAQPASVDSVSSNDLPPPEPAKPVKIAAVAAKPAPKQIAAAAKPVEFKHAETKTVAQNRWTGRPHFDDATTVVETQKAEIPTPAPVAKPVAKAAAPVKTVVAANHDKAFIWPVNGSKILSGFGPKKGGKVNDGINIAADNGEPVWAAADGEVVYVGNELQGYGNMVLVKHANGKTTTYAHMGSISVDKYDRVKQGDIIGYVGSTGNVKEPQLHFAIRDGKDPVDPRKYLATRTASN